jgi:hypothetical protein
MSNTDTSGPAFPLVYDVPSEDLRHIHVGMTLRDYFAAKALQGFASNAGPSDGQWDIDARAAYKIADAMLKARDAS